MVGHSQLSLGVSANRRENADSVTNGISLTHLNGILW